MKPDKIRPSVTFREPKLVGTDILLNPETHALLAVVHTPEGLSLLTPYDDDVVFELAAASIVAAYAKRVGPDRAQDVVNRALYGAPSAD